MVDWMDLEQFQARYVSEEACARALFDAKWPDGFRCSRCHGRHAYYIQTRKLYECVACGYQSSLTAGTIMEGTRTSLRKWFLALFMIARLDGVSATELKRILEVTYKTAWTMLMKIRYAISQEHESHTLSGMVRLKAAIYGDRIWSPISKYVPGEYPVIIGATVGETGEPEQLKIKQVDLTQSIIPSTKITKWHIKGFESRYVGAGATEVLSSTHIGGKDPFIPLTYIVKQVEAWVNKTFIAISEKHWQKYIDEFSYRYSLDEGYRLMIREGRYKKRSCWEYRVKSSEQRLRYASSSVFQSLLHLGMNDKALTYAQIISWKATRSDAITEYYAA